MRTTEKRGFSRYGIESIELGSTEMEIATAIAQCKGSKRLDAS